MLMKNDELDKSTLPGESRKSHRNLGRIAAAVATITVLCMVTDHVVGCSEAFDHENTSQCSKRGRPRYVHHDGKDRCD